MDKRLFEIESWAREVLGENVHSLRPASADASFRRYFRITLSDTSYIIMDAPPDKESTGAFMRAGRAMSDLGLHPPRIFDASKDRGLVLLEDFGDRLYLDELNDESADELYSDAISALLTLQRGPQELPDISFPPYDAALLESEMNLFGEWYVSKHLRKNLDSGQLSTLHETMDLLTASALRQPQTWVHRDYHSRNLMVVPDNNPGILDFQDMVVGPVSYDLVSLLKDCYIRWPRSRVEQWIDTFLENGQETSTGPGFERDHFVEWFDLMGVQRHLKVLGIFARLNHRDGKPQYLEDLPLVLEYILETSAVYSTLAPLRDLLLELHPDAESA